MDNFFGKTLAELRKAKKLMQKDVAAALQGYGIDISSKTIYNWEKELALPNAKQFLALCDILDVSDPLWQFSQVQKGTYAGLNAEGRRKAREFIEILSQVDSYKDKFNDYHYEHTENELAEPLQRYINLYDTPVAAGNGVILDGEYFVELEVDKTVPDGADFAVKVSGDSMEPRFIDGQIIFIKKQSTLEVGEVGIFEFRGESFVKKLGIGELISLNPKYEPIKLEEFDSLHVFGKVVG